MIQTPVYQAQAPAQQMQGVLKTDFENYVKAIDAVLRNIQNQGQCLQNQMTNLTKMLSKFISSNTASSSKLDRTNALADSGASINLLPHSIYKQLGLEALKPTRMTLELANRSVTHPMGIAEDVVIRVDGFTFLADFVVVSSSVKTSDNLEEFADELALLKKGVHEENFQVYSNPIFEFDDNLPLSKEGYYDSEGDVIFLESLLSDDTTHNLDPEVIFDHEPKQNESIHNTSITFSPRSDPLHHEFAGELLTIPSRIVREHEEYLSLMTLLCEISTSRSPKMFMLI
ncbi:reverse transcriptase domain-containing protein [Tanacetum coccineum]|uniref:Reverse transcriptase domain-containing protein n=1 Tax=Tanacetum coccineum TaxID=301880 RepID=A0ABQ5H253_9ASTR